MTCLGWGALHDRTMIFLALKYSGPSLQQQQLSPRWTAGIRAAVEAIHGAGVLHGDLHFGNLVGTDPSYVKLIDFSNASTSGHSLKAQTQERERFLLRLAQVGLLAMPQQLFVSVFSQSAQQPCVCMCWQRSVILSMITVITTTLTVVFLTDHSNSNNSADSNKHSHDYSSGVTINNNIYTIDICFN